MSGYSLHIGLNHCDPAAYPGWDSTLSGCINDANSMMQLASSAGFRTKRMIDGEATSNAVLAAIGSLAKTCVPGDIALISYSGHGGQVADTTGDETDGQDETWVLYDRQVVDDELAQIYQQFQAGVRILVVSDSCHSGTVARAVLNIATRYAVTSNRVGTEMWPEDVSVEIAKPRAMPVATARADSERRSEVYGLVQTLTRGVETRALGASLILLSGCQDNQLSYDGAVNGAFTTALLQVWNQGRYTGDYRAFLSAIVAKMPPDQTPNFFTDGSVDAFALQKPFTIDVAQPGASVPTPATRPVLRQGSKGPDVVYLQQRLAVHGYPLAADGDFGPSTHNAVRAFQTSKGLTADGVVGPVTWSALERAASDAGSGGAWGADTDTSTDTDTGTDTDTDGGGWGDGGGDTDSDSDSDTDGDDWGDPDAGGDTDTDSEGGWGESDSDDGWGDDAGETDSESDTDSDTGDGGWGDDTGNGDGGDEQGGGW